MHFIIYILFIFWFACSEFADSSTFFCFGTEHSISSKRTREQVLTRELIGLDHPAWELRKGLNTGASEVDLPQFRFGHWSCRLVLSFGLSSQNPKHSRLRTRAFRHIALLRGAHTGQTHWVSPVSDPGFVHAPGLQLLLQPLGLVPWAVFHRYQATVCSVTVNTDRRRSSGHFGDQKHRVWWRYDLLFKL